MKHMKITTSRMLEPSPPLEDNKQREVTPQVERADMLRAEVMDEVRAALYEYGDMEELAGITGKSTGCLYAIRSGRTRWPRWDTLFQIMPHIGLALTVRRIRNATRGIT